MTRKAEVLSTLQTRRPAGESTLRFQTRPHLPDRTDDLLASVITRSLRRIDRLCAFGSERIATHDSVRVEFESTRTVPYPFLYTDWRPRTFRVQIRSGDYTLSELRSVCGPGHPRTIPAQAE